MPKIAHDRLKAIGEALMIAHGVSAEEAEIVMRHSVEANLVGHDSHGIIQIPTYLERVKQGHIVPGAPWQIVQESATTTVIDGNWGFGYVVNEKAMKYTIEKAKKSNVAAATVFRQSHIGRVGAYPAMAAAEGMIGICTADSGRTPKHVAPFGGREARLGTNPISIGIPSDLEGPMVLDMATSAVAAGKIGLAVARNEQIPHGWIVDKEGNPTHDPNDYKRGGVLLPLGGSEGYKGTGLGVMVEILCGLLTGLGFGIDPNGAHNDGCFIAVFNVEAFRPLKQFKSEVAEFSRFLKSSAPAKGSTGVYYPGEVEYLKHQARIRDGIDVEDATWKKLADMAAQFGMTEKLGF